MFNSWRSEIDSNRRYLSPYCLHALRSCRGEAVRDWLSFRRFCGLPLDRETPDHASIWRFRQTTDKLGLAQALLAEVNRQLDARGLIVKSGALVDATLIAAAVIEMHVSRDF